MFQPAYYLGRRVYVFHAASHPCTYVYTFVRQQSTVPHMRLAKAEAYWNYSIRKNPRFS